MGLTVHYRMRHPEPLTPAQCEALVRRAHRESAELARARGLAEVGPVAPADPNNPWHGDMLMERCGENESRCHDIRPECGWLFSVHPGPGCESALFGLCRFPHRLRVGRRTLATGCGGWTWSSFCKTQYASLHGAENFILCHVAVIDLVLVWRSLGCEIHINDEGDYWPERHLPKLRAEVAKMNRLVAAFAGAMKDTDSKVEAPILAARDFEHLEAEGAAELGERLPATVDMVSRLSRQGGHILPEP
jgi:hypothetical protein